MKDCFLETDRLCLRSFNQDMMNGNYVSWLNDPEVCRFNDHHFFPYTEQEANDYIKSVADKKNIIALQIIEKESGTHIGNLSLYNINYIYRSAGIGILLGEKDFWGDGYAKEAICKIIAHGFMELGLNRIFCGTSENNTAMQKIAISLNMTKEGVSREAVFKNGEFSNLIIFSILRKEFISRIYSCDKK